MDSHFSRMCLIGCGLIGGSLSLALQKTGAVARVIGYDANPEALRAARERGVINEAADRLEDALRHADLIVLAAPSPVVLDLLPLVQKNIHLAARDVLITDVCSTKSSVVDRAKQCGLHAQFLGGHPMAGSEKSGVYAADALLLENAVYVLTPESTQEVQVRVFSDILKRAGCRVRFMDAVDHDRVVAAISHVPHLIASTLVSQVKDLADRHAAYAELAAGGFRDITRIASADPALWRDITLENRAEILPMLDDFIARVNALKALLSSSDKAHLHHFFDDARTFRDALPARSTGAIRAVFAMTVSVPDEPGMIGRIAMLLGNHHISIRNIGILESREEDLGQLLLQFDTIHFHDDALSVLQREGYQIIDRV